MTTSEIFTYLDEQRQRLLAVSPGYALITVESYGSANYQTHKIMVSTTEDGITYGTDIEQAVTDHLAKLADNAPSARAARLREQAAALISQAEELEL
jgi:hypothetical protein